MRSAGRPEATAARVASALVAVLVGSILVALARPGGPVLADAAAHLDPAVPLPTLADPDAALVQRFEAEADGLSTVSVRVGTFGGNDDCALRFRLVEVRSQAQVAASDRDCADIPDSVLIAALEFPPVPRSAGRSFALEVRPVAGARELVTLWGATSDDLDPASLGGRRLEGTSVEVHAGYGRDARAWDQIGRALDRLDDFGPPWRSGWVAVVLVLVAVGAVALAPFAEGRRVVVLLLVLAVAKGLLWSIVVPPLEGVDETSHVAYAQYLGEQGRIPDRGASSSGGLGRISEELEVAIRELHQSALRPTDRPDFGREARITHDALAADLDRRANGDSSAAGYAPHYYVGPALLERLPGAIDARIGTMRLWSVALGAVAVLLTYALGVRVFPAHPIAATVLGIAVALHPEFSQQTAIVNNDAGVVAATAWCLVLAHDLAQPIRRSRNLVMLAALAAGLAFVTKGFAVGVVPLVGCAWVIGRLRGQRPGPVRVDALSAALGFALGYGSWYVIAAVLGLPGVGLTGEPSPGARTIGAFVYQLRRGWFLTSRRNWVDQFWGNVSWVDTPFPRWTQTIILVACLTGAGLVLVWLGSAMWRYGRLATSRLRGQRAAAPTDQVDLDAAAGVQVLALLATAAVLYAIMYLHFRNTARFDLIQGRYALQVVPAVLATPALCLRALRPRWSPVPVLVAAAGAMAALQVLSIALLTERFYL